VLRITSPKDPASSRGIVLWIPEAEDRTSRGRVAVVFGAGGGFAVFVVFVFVAAVMGVVGVGMRDFGGAVEPAHFEDGTWGRGSLSLSLKKVYVVAI
jgi:hypothetical protein